MTKEKLAISYAKKNCSSFALESIVERHFKAGWDAANNEERLRWETDQESFRIQIDKNCKLEAEIDRLRKFISELAPSWLPEGVCDYRRQILREVKR